MKRRHLQLAVLLVIGGAALFQFISSSQAQREVIADLSAQRALVSDYCVSCHNQKKNTAGISLENLDYAQVSVNADVWEKVLRKLRTGQMPPPEAPAPEAS